MKRVYTFNRILYRFLRAIVTPWYRKRYPFRLTNPEILREMKPPFVLLPNHMMKWDVVLMGLLIKDPIHYMASDSHFRNPIPAFFMKRLGAFPKAKAKSDLKAIKHMMGLKEKSKVICIFPEGQMSWDGLTMPLFYSTAKLLKLLKIPVYVLSTRGAYAVQPRWSKARRSGPVEMTIHALSRDGKSLRQRPTAEIYDEIGALLTTDEYRVIRENHWEYQSDSLAEYLENFLFICPACLEIAGMRSEGDQFRCTRCGFSQTLSPSYRFRSADGSPPRFDTPGEWNEWQRTTLKELLLSYGKEDTHKPFMADSGLRIRTGYRRNRPEVWTEKGDLALFQDHLLLRPARGDVRLIPLEELSGIHVMTRQKLEFYHHKTLYMFDFPDIRLSGYKWLCALRTLGLPSSYAWAGEEPEKT